jgi:EthD domain
MTVNYSQRDDNVRHGVYASVRKRDGLPHELFSNYWRDVHATLCSRLPGLGFYVQQHFDRNHTANLWPLADGMRRISAVLDGSAELGFASLQDQAHFSEASTVLYADERNLFSEAIAYVLPTGSRTFVDREKDGIRNGPDRLHRIHVYMNRKSGTDAARWIEDTSATLSADAVVQKWKVSLPEAYDNANPAPPSPDVGHYIEGDRVRLAIAEVAFENARTANEFFAGSRVRKFVREQPQYLDAIGAYLVTGFYTFVRDGTPTAAGLRGSRAAELIDSVGAANQLATDVVDHFISSHIHLPDLINV